MKLMRRICGLGGDGHVGEDSVGVPSQLNSPSWTLNPPKVLLNCGNCNVSLAESVKIVADVGAIGLR